MTDSVYEKLSALFSEFGVLDAGLYGLSRLLGRLKLGKVFRYTLVAQPVEQQRNAVNTRRTIEVRQTPADEYQYHWFPRPENVIRDRFDQGAICLTAFQGDVPIGCIWLIRNNYLEDEVRCRYVLSPADKTAWDFDVFLLPEYRFGRGFGRLWSAADTLLRDEGRDWSLSRINAFNASSLRAHQRRGARIIGQALFLCFGRVQLLLSNCPPYGHLSLNTRKIPELRLSVKASENSPEV